MQANVLKLHLLPERQDDSSTLLPSLQGLLMPPSQISMQPCKLLLMLCALCSEFGLLAPMRFRHLPLECHHFYLKILCALLRLPAHG